MSDSVRHKIQEIKYKQLESRINLELALETTQRDSRYSNTLVDLMRREEEILKDPRASASARGIVQRVDEALKQETEAFFAKATQMNIKRWQMLAEKLNKDRQQLRSEVSRASGGAVGRERASSRGYSIQRGSARRVPTPEEIEVESERLDYEYSKNWYKYENFNLQEAFQSQSARVENDWKTHENSIADEFNARRTKITGIDHSRHAQHNHASVDSDQRWQHPEKQKTLIHTAPVHSPNSTLNSSGDFGRGGLASRGGGRQQRNSAELDRLEKEYKQVMESLQNQKGDAKRWLHRQQVRLVAQTEQVRKERSVIADILLDIQSLNNLVKEYMVGGSGRAAAVEKASPA